MNNRTGIALTLMVAFALCAAGCDSDGSSGSAPRIGSITPSTVATGDLITIAGSNLANAGVTIQGISAFVTANTSMSISTSVPAGATVGTREVRVTNDGGTATATIEINQIGAPPTITSISPDPVSLGEQIVITGTGYHAGAAVEVATIVATVTGSTPTTITATVPTSGIVKGQQASVRVTTPLGTIVSQVFINN